MKTRRMMTVAILAFFGALTFQSCSTDGDKDTEFVADDNSFKNFMS